MRTIEQPDETSQETEDFPTIPFDRGYLTDGRGLFHIERTLLNDPRGELLVELEDCGKLELIVCSARSVAELGMRPVLPLRIVSASCVGSSTA
jgi:hypothetical protein